MIFASFQLMPGTDYEFVIDSEDVLKIKSKNNNVVSFTLVAFLALFISGWFLAENHMAERTIECVRGGNGGEYCSFEGADLHISALGVERNKIVFALEDLERVHWTGRTMAIHHRTSPRLIEIEEFRLLPGGEPVVDDVQAFLDDPEFGELSIHQTGWAAHPEMTIAAAAIGLLGVIFLGFVFSGFSLHLSSSERKLRFSRRRWLIPFVSTYDFDEIEGIELEANDARYSGGGRSRAKRELGNAVVMSLVVKSLGDMKRPVIRLRNGKTIPIIMSYEKPATLKELQNRLNEFLRD